ncbi:MAG: hypothetical protein WCY71_12365 [Halothiobacillaceae bacterium]
MSAFKWIFLLIGLFSGFIACHTAIFLTDTIWLAFFAGALSVISFIMCKIAP